jgi:peptidoglycan-N-acetylglucosamine deacetylase
LTDARLAGRCPRRDSGRSQRPRARHLVLAILLLAGGRVVGGELALSFDDGLDPRRVPEAAAWNAAILEGLAAAGVRSILFAAGRNVESPAGLPLVADWGRAGHEIGNHSYAHAGLTGTMTVARYLADIDRNARLVGSVPGYVPRFRYPFLAEGETVVQRDGVRRGLAARGYLSGAVSVDASDWYYANRFVAWREAHPAADPAPFRDAYLAHILGRVRYYDNLACELLGRSPRHVLLLHTNAINAAFLPDLITALRGAGFTLITPEDAYADPLYAKVTDVLPAGQSLLWSLARAGGRPGLRFPAEDEVYEAPVLDARGL